MDAFIRALVASSVAGVLALAQAAMERILWLYGVVVAVGTAIRFGWNHLVNSAKFWANQVWTFSGQVYGTLWYIINVRIPQMVNAGIDNVVTWTVAIYRELELRFNIAIQLISDWVVARVYELLDFLARLTEWATRGFAEVWETLTWAAGLVFWLLTSPERMAAWLFGALIRHILMYINDNAESLLDIFRRKSVQYAGLVAMRIEEVLVRLL